MAERKHITELALNMHCVRLAILQQQSLSGPELLAYFDEDHTCHIYAICRRPRLTLQAGNVEITDRHFAGTMHAAVRGEQIPIPFKASRQSPGPIFEFRAAYPFTEFELVAPNGRVFFQGVTGQLVPFLGLPHHDLHDLEVLYVGQSFGEVGERVAPDRLQSHSTLQYIYAEAIRRCPDMDIWIVLFGFDAPYLLMHMDGTAGNGPSTNDEDDVHIFTALQKGVTDQQRINYTEAAMIRYFQPEYNKMFKDTFPSPAHKTYAECYELDLNAVMVEIQSQSIHAKLCSSSRCADWEHYIAFELHSRSDRVGFFDFGGTTVDQIFGSSNKVV